ncbi:hypothetical protein LguiB_015776 [Lonicera macranthoides]
MAEAEMGDQPHQSIEEDHNDDDEVEEDIHQQEAQQHLIIEEDDENYNSDLSDEEADYSHEDEYDEEEYEEEEGEDEEEEELMNEDLENGVETASCSSKENEGGWNRSEIDGLFCPICMEAWSNGGDHQVCCLPCGHIYGLSCIKTWIQRHRSSRKCPQCNQKCTLKGVRVLYASRIVAVDEELQKKVLLLEAKCASLKKKNAKYSKEAVERQNKEASLSMQLIQLSKSIAGKQTSQPEPSYEKAEAEAHSEAELEAPSSVPYEKRIVNLLHAIYTRSHARLEKVEADIRTKFEAIKARLLVIEEHMSLQSGEHHFPPWPSNLFGGDKDGEE